MIELWIPVTLAAAFLQNLRSALQKALRGRLSTAGAAYARFLYALPLAWLYVWALEAFGGFERPEANAAFLAWCAAGGLAQILFTAVLLWMFTFRSFAVGTAFSKLEVVLVAALGAALLGDAVGPLAWLAVAVGGAGAVALAAGESGLSAKALARGLAGRTTWAGLLCATLLGLSSVGFRGAALALDGPDFVMAAAWTLAVALTMQTAMMGAWFVATDRTELVRVFRAWRRAAPAGVTGMACSACWFTAFTLQNAAYVRAVGQVELLFTFAASVFVFREKVAAAEVFGATLILAAILLILMAA
jgi:drug/metabolite transporter (DMT)-like permease